MSMCESIFTIALACTVKYLHYCDYYYTLGNDSQSTPKLSAYELGIHERFLTISTAVLHVFCPQKLFADSIAEQLLVDVSVVRHTLVRWYLVLFGEHEPLKLCVSHRFIKRP